MEEKHVVLIVDDTPENLHLLEEMLEQQGYEMQIATNGPDALEVAGTAPHPDLILLDIMMPGMDGYEVCRRLKEHRSVEVADDISMVVLKLTGELP